MFLDKNYLAEITKIAGKVIGKSQNPLPTIFDRAVLWKAKAITTDPSHPLHSAFRCSRLDGDSGSLEPAATFLRYLCFPLPSGIEHSLILPLVTADLL